MNSSTMSVEDKIVKSSYSIRMEMPYYSAAYVSLPKEKVEYISTMGVSENRILYNEKFVSNLSVEELNFVNLHEIMHIVLKHVTRGKNKDRKLWNVAADLIVNSFIISELEAMNNDSSIKGCVIPNSEVVIGNKLKIKVLNSCLYCSSIDLETDTVDKIYNSLYKQAEQNGYLTDKNNLQLALDNSLKTYHFEIVGTGDVPKSKQEFRKFTMDIGVQYSAYIDGQGENGDGRPSATVKDTFGNGSDIKKEMNGQYDLMDDNCSKEESEQKANKILSKIKTKIDLDNIRQHGLNGGGILIEIDKALQSKFNWKKFVQKYCIQLNSKDSSFLRPDKRMYYQKAIYPGQYTVSEDALQNIKICIDTSGSISYKDFSYFMGQIKLLLDKYRVDAEVIYWDGEVQTTGDFNSYQELMDISAKGRGGTDPSCVYDYLLSVKCKKKAALVIIFTDGYFSESLFKEKRYNKLLKNTLWVMTRDHNEKFNPTVGKVGIPEFPDNT